MGTASLLGWTQSGGFRQQNLMLKKKKRSASRKTKAFVRKHHLVQTLNYVQCASVLFSLFLSVCTSLLCLSGSYILDSSVLILCPSPHSIFAEDQGSETGHQDMLVGGWRCWKSFSDHLPFLLELQAPRIAPRPIAVSLGSHLLLNCTCL